MNFEILKKTLTEVLVHEKFNGTGKIVQKIGLFIGFEWGTWNS